MYVVWHNEVILILHYYPAPAQLSQKEHRGGIILMLCLSGVFIDKGAQSLWELLFQNKFEEWPRSIVAIYWRTKPHQVISAIIQLLRL